MSHLSNTTTTTLIFAIGVAMLVGCSSTRNKTNVVKTSETTTQSSQTSDSATPAATEAMAADRNVVSSIEFKPGAKRLSPEATAELNRAILEAKQRGAVEEVHIAVWADQEAPARTGAALPRSQVRIAKERGENIENYMDQMEPAADIQIHNMTTKSESFADYLNTQDVVTKSRLADLGVSSNPDTDEISGPTSSALVFIKVK